MLYVGRSIVQLGGHVVGKRVRGRKAGQLGVRVLRLGRLGSGSAVASVSLGQGKALPERRHLERRELGGELLLEERPKLADRAGWQVQSLRQTIMRLRSYRWDSAEN